MAAKVELQSVQLVEARLELGSIPVYDELEADIKVKKDFERTGRCLDVVVGVWLRLVPVGQEGEAETEEGADGRGVLSIVAEHRARYTLPERFDAADEEFEAFVEQTCVLSVWPYARETIQSLAAKAGFPQVTLPMRKVALPASPGARRAGSAAGPNTSPTKKASGASRRGAKAGR